MPRLEDPKVAIISFVDNKRIIKVNLVVLGPGMVCHIRAFSVHFHVSSALSVK